MSNNDDKPVPADPPAQNSADAVEQAQTQETPSPPAARRGGGVLGGLALLVALAALGASAWLAYQAYLEPTEENAGQQLQALATLEQSIETLQERLAGIDREQQNDRERLGRIADRVDSREAQLAPLEQGLGRVDERTAALGQQVRAMEEALVDRTAETADLRRRLEAAVEQLDARGDLQREVDRDLRQQMLMLEAASLLRIGQDLAEVQGDSRQAQRVFERARVRLERVDDARLEPVRRSLVREIEALATHDGPNLDAELARLERLGRESESWPLQLPGSGPTADPAPEETGDGWRARLGRSFGALVRVESRDALGRDEEQFEAAGEHMKLRLLAAELALMRRDAAALGTQMEAAIALLEAWFEPGAEPVVAARAEFQRLAGLDLNPEPPALGSALAQLQARLDDS